MARKAATRSADSALRGLRWFKQFQRLPGGGEERLPSREVSRILGHECGPSPYRFQRDQKVAKVADEIHLPQGTPRASQKNASINPRRAGWRGEMTEGHMGPAQFIQSPLLPMVVSPGVEFSGHNCGQDRSLEDASVLAQPQVFLSPAEANVNASIEQEGTRRQRSHLFFVGA